MQAIPSPERGEKGYLRLSSQTGCPPGVIAMLVRQCDADQPIESQTHGRRAPGDLARAEPGIDEEHAAVVLERAAIAARAGSEHEETGHPVPSRW